MPLGFSAFAISIEYRQLLPYLCLYSSNYMITLRAMFFKVKSKNAKVKSKNAFAWKR